MISIKKLNEIINRYQQGETINRSATAKRLKISRTTLKRYLAKLSSIDVEKIKNENAFISHFSSEKQKPLKYQQLISLFPSILEMIECGSANLVTAWREYNINQQDGYKRSQFNKLFSDWCKLKGIHKEPSNKWKSKLLNESDTAIFNEWKRSVNRREWERAIVITEAHKGTPIRIIAKKIERSEDRINHWIKNYQKNGIDALYKKKRKVCEGQVQNVKRKRNNLMRLVHQTPKIHHINRASWCLKSLSKAYRKEYKELISTSTISEYIKKEGYSFRKAREVLTSPDPEYREKLQRINCILSNLSNKEKFFSIDEFGPFAIKIKGGRSLVKNGKLKTFPQLQKSKGFLICTAALELSTNQISHFYSLKKNTKEMIKLLDLIIKEYPNEERIFFSWDAASWHASKELYTKIEKINSSEYRAINKTPIVELAPLPSSAQFLNVIESVFSGLAKAIIHNSNYRSIDECKNAITQYFIERNEQFKKNPKRAGNKIWGKEIVKAVFDESNNCKDPKFR